MMGLYKLSRIVKISVATVEIISFVILVLWITVIVIDGASSPECVFSEDLNNYEPGGEDEECVDIDVTETTSSCDETGSFDQWENVAFHSYGMLMTVVSIADQIVLYYFADHRWIRKIQMFILYSIVLTVINTSLAVYSGLMLHLYTAGLLVSHVVPRTIQLTLLVKFLNVLISSSPRVSIVASTSPV